MNYDNLKGFYLALVEFTSKCDELGFAISTTQKDGHITIEVETNNSKDSE